MSTAGGLMNTDSKAASDAARYEAARQVLAARGFILHRTASASGPPTFCVRRWGRSRDFADLDQLAAFVRVAMATE